MPSLISPEQRTTYLDKLALGYSHEAAARAAGTTRRSFLRLRQADEDFAKAVGDADEAGVQMLEQEVVKIARAEIDANPTQLRALFGILGARRPKVWRLNANPDAPAVPRRRSLKNLSEEELSNLRELLSRLERPAADA